MRTSRLVLSYENGMSETPPYGNRIIFSVRTNLLNLNIDNMRKQPL